MYPTNSSCKSECSALYKAYIHTQADQLENEKVSTGQGL